MGPVIKKKKKKKKRKPLHERESYFVPRGSFFDRGWFFSPRGQSKKHQAAKHARCFFDWPRGEKNQPRSKKDPHGTKEVFLPKGSEKLFSLRNKAKLSFVVYDDWTHLLLTDPATAVSTWLMTNVNPAKHSFRHSNRVPLTRTLKSVLMLLVLVFFLTFDTQHLRSCIQRMISKLGEL